MNDHPNMPCLFCLMFAAMAIAGTVMLCVAGNRYLEMIDFRFDGSWLALPVALFIAFLFLFPFMRLASRSR